MIRLVSLELFGFKSFADRTRFEFPAGVTAVVGPNGSGKSNVVDAIKWVLGEQSVRSLRGKEMTDVIFAGTAGRKPLNAAEVSLVFDNAARALPVDAERVQITRRVYRGGESEYLVNGEPTRLRAIRELFSGTGAATEAYSVIEQGRVDALLVASGRDRRIVFEEAAGITRFRVRRAEALRRLERSEQDRRRLADIVGELTQRLETVRQQAARARRWQQLTDRLRTLRVAAAGTDLGAVDGQIARAEAQLAAARDESLGLAAEEAAATDAAEALAARLAGLAPQLEAARTASSADAQRAAAAAAALGVQRETCTEPRQDVARAEEALRSAARAESATQAGAHAAGEAVATLATRLAEVEARLAAAEQAASGSHLDVDAARRALAEATESLTEAHRHQSDTRAESERRAERAAAAAAAMTEACDARDAARAREAAWSEAEAARSGALAMLERRLAAATAELEAVEADHRSARGRLEAAWRDHGSCQARLQACEERHGLLGELVARNEGLSDAARRLLAAADAGPPGCAGLLADLVPAGVEWATLVDLALGRLGHSLVLESLAAALDWHATWSGSPRGQQVLAGGGRIGLLPADALGAPPAYDPGSQPGLVGRLDRLVAAATDDAAPRHPLAAALTERLLGVAWVVDRIEHALPLLAEAPAGTLFLSRAGACLSATGGLEIGGHDSGGGLVARRAELRAVAQRLEEIGRETAAAAATIETFKALVETHETEIASARGRRQDVLAEISATRAECDRGRRERTRVEAEIEAAETLVRARERAAAQATAAMAAGESLLREADLRLADCQAAQARAQAAVAELDRSRTEVLDEINGLRLERATTAAALARARDEAAAATAACATRCAETGLARDRLHAAVRRLEARELDLLAAGQTLAEAAAAAEQAERVLAALLAEHAGAESRCRDSREAAERARRAVAARAATIHELDMAAAEARHRRARVVERIRDDYGIDLDAAAPPTAADAPTDVPADRAELDREIEDLRRRLASYVSVNLEALEESEALAARLATLQAQLDDVTGARTAIEQLVARIDDESRKLLADTIETVRGHFRELFTRLFGGGQADIVLEDGVDLLETAVEIVARPPGKEPRGISLLSGGEKTMTCVALLLSIFKSRPSPFCVLDEVDAALDEANVDRFVGVLRDFLSATQFIVVTHSKKTMAAADTLYGITMEEPGVSKRISVRFESAAAAGAGVARAA